jgi:hypothetical protein
VEILNFQFKVYQEVPLQQQEEKSEPTANDTGK